MTEVRRRKTKNSRRGDPVRSPWAAFVVSIFVVPALTIFGCAPSAKLQRAFFRPAGIDPAEYQTAKVKTFLEPLALPRKSRKEI